MPEEKRGPDWPIEGVAGDPGGVAVEERTAAAPVAKPASKSASIDVGEVLRELHPQQDGVADRFGFDLAVHALPASQRQPLMVEPCAVCKGESATPVYAVESTRFRVVECSACGLGTLHPRPQVDEIATFYPPAYYGVAGDKFSSATERLVRWAAARRMRSLLKEVPAAGRVLDIGCGRGVALTAAVESGFEAHGFEISRTAAEGLDSRVHLKIAESVRRAEYPSEQFDLVILWHVLEHLPDPRETLEEIRRILTPGGRLAVAVPNFNSLQSRLFGPAWFHLDLPRHLYHFPAAALQRLLIECGFRVERVGHSSLRQNPFGWVQSALNALRPTRRNELYALLKRQGDSSSGFAGVAQRLAYWIGMPAAVITSALTAACRSGATVSITVRKPNRST